MFRAGEPAEGGSEGPNGIWGRVLAAIAYAFMHSGLCFEDTVAMSTSTGEKLTARIAPLFVQLYKNEPIGTRRTTVVSTLFFAPLLTVVAPSFATVYTVDYAARAAAVVVTIPLVVLVLLFRGGEVLGPAAGTVAR